MSRERPGDVVVLDREYEGTTETLRVARNDVVGFLETHTSDQDLRERAELVVSELATNAVQASPGSTYSLHLSVEADGSIALSVTSSSDREVPPPRESWGPVTAIATRGRGLLIVGKLSDTVDVAQPAAGVVVITVTFRAASPR
jgi:anti-sigma regulatory factor (Ser/Thr protein kinase)